MKRSKFFTIFTVTCLLFVVAVALCACDFDAIRDRIVCEYWYYKDVDGTTVRECDYLKVDVADKEGNVLDFGGVTMAPPDGYSFDGFYNDDTGEKMFDVNYRQIDGTKVDRLVTLSPIWVPIQFTFLFVESEEAGKINVDESKTFLLTIENSFEGNFHQATPTAYNTEFVGWYGNPDSPNDLVETYTGGLKFKWDTCYKHEKSYVDENGTLHQGDFVILRPKFEVIKRTVLLKAITASNNVYEKEITVVNNDPMPDLSVYKRKYEGKYIYDFSTSQTEYIPFSGNVTADITLYAVWESFKNVTLHCYDAYTKTIEVLELSGATFPAVERNHYTFAGWYDNASFDGAQVFAPKYADNTSDYYGKWTPVSYPLSFVTNGGDALSDGSYVYGEGTTLPIPTKYQNKFLGWCLDEELATIPIFEMPTDAVGEFTLYAKWEASIAISTKDELIAIANNPNVGYYLTNDINLEGEAWIPISTFRGNIEGNGHSIVNFSLQTSTSANSYAFINENYGIITNLTFKDMSIGYYNVKHAGLITAKNYGTIDNCHVVSKDTDTTACALQYQYAYSPSGQNVISNALYAGMITAYNDEQGIVTNCSSSTPIKVTFNVSSVGSRYNGHVYVDLYLGAVCGQNKGMISGCSGAREIQLVGETECENGLHNTMFPEVFTLNNYLYVAGVVGANMENATVTSSSSTAKLSNGITFSGGARGFNYSNFGGVVGYNKGKVTTSYSQDVEMSGQFTHHHTDIVGLGGVVGRNTGTGEIANCYSKNFKTTATNITSGGLVGNNFGKVQTSYVLDATIKIESSSIGWYVGGFVGYNHTTASIRNCVIRVTIDLPFTHALVQHFAGDSVGVMQSCYYSDGGKEIIAGEEQQTINADSNATQMQDESIFTQEFLVEDLYWSEGVWHFDGTNAPTLK